MNKLIFLLLVIAVLSGSASAQIFKSVTTKKASEQLRGGDVKAAIAILTKAIENQKDLLEAYHMRGNLNAMIGNITGAIADYTSALEINPTDANILKQRAMYRSFRRDSAGALKDYDSAIANGLKTDRIYASRAEVKRDIGDMNGATDDYRTALAFNPNLASAYIGLSYLLEKKGDEEAAIIFLRDFLDRYEGKSSEKLPVVDGKITNSINIKRKGLENDGSQVYLEGVTSISNSKTRESEDFIAKKEQTMNVSMAYFTLGRLYSKKDDFDNALANYEKGLKINRNDAYGYKLRSEIKMKKGDLKGTIEDLTTTMNLEMHLPDNHLDKGILLLLQGKDAEAQIEFDLHLLRFPAGKEHLEKRIVEAKKLRDGHRAK